MVVLTSGEAQRTALPTGYRSAPPRPRIIRTIGSGSNARAAYSIFSRAPTASTGIFTLVLTPRRRHVIGQDNGTTFGTPWPNLVAVGVAVTAHNDTWADPNTGLPAGATAVIANLQTTFPPAMPPSVLGRASKAISGVTNVLGCEASLTFAATNNAIAHFGGVPGPLSVVQEQFGRRQRDQHPPIPGCWMSSDNGASYYCQASLAAPYNAITLNSATATIGVLPSVYLHQRLEDGDVCRRHRPDASSRRGNVGPATWVKLEAEL